MTVFNWFAYAATAATQIALSALIVWFVASNWLFDKKLIIVSIGLATLLVVIGLPLHDDRLPVAVGIVVVILVGSLMGAAWLKRHQRLMDNSNG